MDIRFKKGFYGLLFIPTIFQENTDRTLNYQTPVWIDDIILVTKEDKEKHREKLFEILEQLQKAWYRASEKNSEFFLKKTTWLGHDITEHRNKPNKEKIKSYIAIKTTDIM